MEERLRILLCEDDENLGMLLREYLQAKGFNADLFADGESGYKAFLKGKYVRLHRKSAQSTVKCLLSS